MTGFFDGRRSPPTIYENVDVALARQYRDEARAALDESGEVVVAVNAAKDAAIADLQSEGAEQISAATDQAVRAEAAAAGVAESSAKIGISYTLANENEAAAAGSPTRYYRRAAGSSNILTFSPGRFFDVGSDLAAGDIFDTFEADTFYSGTATSIVLKVWKRPLQVGGVANPNLNADFGAANDVLLATYTYTPASLGITTATKRIQFPIAYTQAEAGFTYGFERYALDGGNAKLQMGYARFGAGTAQTPTSADARIRGFTHTTAAGGFSAVPANYSTSDGLQRRSAPLKTADVQAKADAAAGLGRRLEQMAARRRANYAALVSQSARFILAVPGGGLVGIGDSNFRQLPSLGILVGNRITDRVNDYLPGVPFYNKGLPARDSNYIASFCEQAEGTVGPVVENGVAEPALTAAQKAMLAVSMVGTNDAIVKGAAATILANMKRIQAVFGDSNRVLHRGYIISTDNATGSLAYAESRRNAELSKAEFGGRYIDTQYESAKAASKGTDRLNLKRGQIPAEFVDASKLHWNNAFSEDGAFMIGGPLRAMSGGAPHVHDDVFAMYGGSAVGTVIGTLRGLWSANFYAGQFRIVSGNNDDIVRLDPATGVLSRGAGPMTDAIRQIEVQIGVRSNIAEITLMRIADGTAPTIGVRVKPTLAAVLSASLQGVVAGPEQTIAMCIKLNGDQAGGGFFHQGLGTTAFVTLNGKVLSYNTYDTTSTTVRGSVTAGASGTIPQVANPYDYHWYFFGKKADGTIYARTDKLPTITGSSTAGDMPIDQLTTVFGNSPNAGGQLDISVKSILMFSTLVDFFTADGNVDLVRDAATGNPRDIGALDPFTGAVIGGGGAVAGATPYLYLSGNAQNFAMGLNRGSGGRLYGPTYYGIPSDLGFEDDLS